MDLSDWLGILALLLTVFLEWDRLKKRVVQIRVPLRQWTLTAPPSLPADVRPTRPHVGRPTGGTSGFWQEFLRTESDETVPPVLIFPLGSVASGYLLYWAALVLDRWLGVLPERFTDLNLLGASVMIGLLVEAAIWTRCWRRSRRGAYWEFQITKILFVMALGLLVFVWNVIFAAWLALQVLMRV